MKNVFTRDTQKDTHKDEHLHTDTHTKWGGGAFRKAYIALGSEICSSEKRGTHTHSLGISDLKLCENDQSASKVYQKCVYNIYLTMYDFFFRIQKCV